jgi:hypothetical protein
LARAERAATAARSGIAVSTMTLPPLFAGVRSSDHRVFARHGIPAFIATDAAPFWRPCYPGRRDTDEYLDYDRLGRTAIALRAVVRELARPTAES